MRQHEAAQFGAEMTIDAFRQRRQDRLPARRHPARMLVTHGCRRDHQVLDQERLVALERGAFRNGRPDHPGLDGEPRCDLAAPPLLVLCRRPRLPGRPVHATGLAGRDVGATLQAFQACDLLPLSGQQSLNLRTGQIGQGGRRQHMT